jgi:sec-independent protein translocase protein TatB
MNIFGVGTAELLIILVIALLVLGPERLPEIARLWAKFTRTMGTFTRTWQDFNTQLTAEINREVEGKPRPAAAPPKPAPPVVAPDLEANTIAPPQLQEQASEPAVIGEPGPAGPAEAEATESLPVDHVAAYEMPPDLAEAAGADYLAVYDLPPDLAEVPTAADTKHE